MPTSNPLSAQQSTETRVQHSPRDVLVVSMRGKQCVPAYTAWFEFEDLICEWEGSDVLSFPYDFQARGFKLPRKAYQLVRSIGASESAALNIAWSPDLDPNKILPPGKTYDLIVMTVSSIFDSFAAHGLRSLLSPGGKLIGIAIETWPNQADERATSLEPFAMFDQFYVSLPSGAQALRERLGPTIRPLLPGGDVLATKAHPDHGRRSIAIVNPGRRSPVQHKRLVEASIADARPYIFDTLAGTCVLDHREHRSSYNRILGQSDLLVCNYAKFDREDVIQGVRDVPGRLFEGLAAGNVLIGEFPNADSLAELGLSDIKSLHFGLDGEGLNLLELLKDEPQLTEFKRANQRIAAQEHDWVHRWSEILANAGFEKTRPANERLSKLRELALTI